MRVLITGFTGFVGSHLADYLVARGDVEVFGMYRWRSRMDNVEHLRDRVQLVECDLRDPGAARHVIRDVRPDRVFHLAAQSLVRRSCGCEQAPDHLRARILVQITEVRVQLGG